MRKALWVVGCGIVLGFLPVMGECPSADVTGDCFVDLADLAAMASQWLTGKQIPEDLIVIPNGTFLMGDSFNEGQDNERPVHTVTLSLFSMSRYEIMNGQYCEFLNSALQQGLIIVIDGVVYKADSGTIYPYCETSTSSWYSQIIHREGIFTVREKDGRNMANDPMLDVSWYGAVAYCNWRSHEEGRLPCYSLSTWECDFSKNGYHLPTEAQWEYAARGGLWCKRFPWGDTITHSQANYYSSSSYSYDISPTRGDHPMWASGNTPYTSPVGSFTANDYGLYDMAGNAWEWCNDLYTTYSSGAQTNPTGPTNGSHHVLRGGSWHYNSSNCRVTNRIVYLPSIRGTGHFGFRLVLDLN